MILYLAMLFILSIFQNMFQNKFKTGFPMCTSESDTQSPAELRVQYPTMPQLLPQPAAAKNSVLVCPTSPMLLSSVRLARRYAGASSARAEGSKRWSERIEPVPVLLQLLS